METELERPLHPPIHRSQIIQPWCDPIQGSDFLPALKDGVSSEDVR